MAELLKSIMLSPSGGAFKLEYRKVANILSTYNLCSTLPFESITASISSAYNLCVPQEEALTVSPTSTYSLSTAVT